MQKKIADIRREKFRQLMRDHGGTAAMAKALSLKNLSYVSQIATGKKTIGEKAARSIETKLRLPPGTLDREDDPPLFAREPEAAYPVLADAIRVVGDAIVDAGMAVSAVPSDKFIELITNVVERAQGSGGKVDPAYAKRLVRLLK